MAAPVTIKVDLDATPALNELAELEVLMKSIGNDFREMDTGSISNDIQEMVDALEKAENRLDGVNRQMRDTARIWNEMDFSEMPDGFTSDEGGAEGGGGSSGGAKTGGGSDKDSSRDLISKLDSLYGSHENIFRTGEQLKMFDGQRRAPNGQFISNTLDPLYDEGSHTTRGRFGQLISVRMKRLQDQENWDGDSTSAANDDFSAIKSDRSRFLEHVRGMLDIDDDGSITGGKFIDSLDGKLKKLMPTMQKWYQLFALITPLLIAAGVQALGVAAALGGVAVAGGALIGLGLIGHANDMGAAFDEAGNQVQDFKEDLFEAFSPTAQQFAPISAEFLDQAPNDLQEVAKSMQGLTRYSDTMFRMWSALTGGLAEFMNILVRNEDVISQLSLRFGGLIGSGILKFFDWLVQSAYRNQEMLLGLWDVLVTVAVTIYNLSVAVSTVSAAFAPLFEILVLISELMNRSIVINLITMIALLFMIGRAAMVIYGLYGGFMALATGVKLAITWMTAYQVSTWGAVAATLALVAAVGMLTLGAATVIGGAVTGGVMSGTAPTGPSTRGNGGGPEFGGGGGLGGSGGMTVNNYNTYKLTNYGQMDKASENRFRDEFNRMDGEKSAKEPPSPRNNSDSSTSDREEGNRSGGGR